MLLIEEQALPTSVYRPCPPALVQAFLACPVDSPHRRDQAALMRNRFLHVVCATHAATSWCDSWREAITLEYGALTLLPHGTLKSALPTGRRLVALQVRASSPLLKPGTDLTDYERAWAEAVRRSIIPKSDLVRLRALDHLMQVAATFIVVDSVKKEQEHEH